MSDPSVVIGTFITLYTVFIGGFGVLAGFLVKRGQAEGWLEVLRVMAIALLVAATGLDLWRVLNSTGDLFTTATSGLSYRTLNDTVYDFKVYFVINVSVVAVSIGVASWLARRRDVKDARSQPNGPAAWPMPPC